MAMSWSTALGSQDDSLESLMARRRLENNGLLQIAQTQDQMKTSQMNRDTLTEQRGAMAEFRQAAAKKLQDDTAAKQAEAAEEKAAKARVEGMLADPDAETKYGKQVMDAIKLQVYAGVKPSVSLTEKDPQAADTMVDTYTYDKDGKPVVTGQIKKGSVAAKIPGAEGSDGPAPYFTPLQTGDGVLSYNNRTGKVDGRVADLKPGATAQEKMAAAETAVYQLGEVKRLFNPDWVGPAAGRYKTMQLAVAGERGEQGLAEMAAQVASLKNQIINLRTGAAMSEPEAQRIMQEIPDMNNPPDVFLSRMDVTQKNIEFLNSRRRGYAYGTPGNSPQAAGVTVPGQQKTDSGPVAVKAGTMVLDPNGKPQRAKKDTTLPAGWKLQ
jgi:hypothetical protein